MIIRSLFASLALSALVVAAPVAASAQPTAQTPAKAQVSVAIGEGLKIEAPRYGAGEYPPLARDLEKAVAARAAKGGFTRLDLVLEYARPNHPTFNQMGLSTGLSLRSVALGGATITGFAERADGARLPLKFSWYETSLRNEIGAATWTDAERAFDDLGFALQRGHVPDRFGSGTPEPRRFLDQREVF